MPGLLACSAWHLRWLSPQSLGTQATDVLLTVLEAGNPTIRGQQVWYLERVYSLVHGGYLGTVVPACLAHLK